MNITNKKVFFSLFFAALFIVGCAPTPVKERTRIKAFADFKSKRAEITSVRYQMLKETATSIGAQAGLAWYAHYLNHMLEDESKMLYRVFNFNALILKDDVLPPVLVEGRTTMRVNNRDTVRLADRVYRIINPPHFVTTAPTWRQYLWMNYQNPGTPDRSLLPKSKEEREIWNRFIKVGWQDGVRQAHEIYDANLARLTRDYKGMIIYRVLLAQNMVTAPYVARTQLGVTGGGNEMRLNDEVLRITTKSQLNANSKTWNPAIYNQKRAKRAHYLGTLNTSYK